MKNENFINHQTVDSVSNFNLINYSHIYENFSPFSKTFLLFFTMQKSSHKAQLHILKLDYSLQQTFFGEFLFCEMRKFEEALKLENLMVDIFTGGNQGGVEKVCLVGNSCTF